MLKGWRGGERLWAVVACLGVHLKWSASAKMEKKDVISIFQDRGIFLNEDVVDRIMGKKDAEKFVRDIFEKLKEPPLVLSLDEIEKFEVKERELEEGREKEKKGEKEGKEKKGDYKFFPSTKKAGAADYDEDIEILKDVTGKSCCEGGLSDFSKLFEYRYRELTQKLRNRREVRNILPIKKINNARDVRLVGIVNEVRKTSQGHHFIEIEDETGVAPLLALKGDPAMQMAETVVQDEVIGIVGKMSKKGTVIIQNILRPDISVRRKKNGSGEPVWAAFVSDIHMGSNTFLEKEWKKFLRWLGSDAKAVKYLVIPGDIVDGIGIYPDQEKDLKIKDVYKQYEVLARQMEEIPDHISVIMQPGNHDAVRLAEPQPALDKDIRNLFPSNVRFVGNPCYFSIHGVEVLAYHGQSIVDFATNVPSYDQSRPMEIMKGMLQRRHLAPIYGGVTPLAPERRDYMIIDRVPDIFVTGHVHVTCIDNYRGVTLINASAWQSQTGYQRMRNIVPDPGKLPIVNLQNGKASIVDFTRPLA